MKKQVVGIFATLTLLLALGIAGVYAQSGLRIKANIPFDFSARATKLTAGEYSVETTASHLVLLRGPEGDMFIQTIGVESRSTSGQARLVFNKYGEKYFLSQIWRDGDTRGLEVPQSKAERELAKMASAPALETIVLLAEQ